MNVDEIVDKKTVFQPGPIGKQGPQGDQGLPGVNAVPADQAVAAYVSAVSAATHAALESWRPEACVTDYGIDNTGSGPVGDALQALVDARADLGGLYFPPGRYLIDHVIRIPTGTKLPFNLQFDAAAYLIATNVMDTMLDIGGTSRHASMDLSTDEDLMIVDGGVFDCARQASSAVSMARNHTVMRDATVINPTVVGVDGSNTSRVIGVTVWCKQTNAIGIRMAGNDQEVRDCKLFLCSTGVQGHGGLSVSGTYIWPGMQTGATTGIVVDGTNLTVTGCYFDTPNTMISIPAGAHAAVSGNLMWVSDSPGYNELGYVGIRAYESSIIHESGNTWRSNKRALTPVRLLPASASSPASLAFLARQRISPTPLTGGVSPLAESNMLVGPGARIVRNTVADRTAGHWYRIAWLRLCYASVLIDVTDQFLTERVRISLSYSTSDDLLRFTYDTTPNTGTAKPATSFAAIGLGETQVVDGVAYTPLLVQEAATTPTSSKTFLINVVRGMLPIYPTEDYADQGTDSPARYTAIPK